MNFIFAIALMIVSYAITALTAKKPATPVPSNLQDFQFPQHNEGTPQAVIFGDVWTSEWMVLYYGNMHTEAIHSKSTSKK
jgi:hypothetical protein